MFQRKLHKWYISFFPIIFDRTQVFANVDHSRADKIYTELQTVNIHNSDKWTSENINLKICGQMSNYEFGRSNDDDGPDYDDDGF